MVPPLCRGNIEFLDLETFALLFVENTVQDAIDVIVNRNQPKDIPNKKSSDLLDKDLFQDVTSTDTFDQSIDESVSAFSTPYLVNIHNKKFNEWPNIGLFRKADMIEYIKRFVNKWELKCNWMYCIDFLCEERNKSSDTYFYDVKNKNSIKNGPSRKCSMNP
ncbi:uncharacterized protein LOC123301247 [Chrysoperla carnea]|uniref:uncharacterized protein LOC123301247 n=1 Tax=Chrysoperla carnea TaxID=189513 RepID=UPI001D086136|nr:uncharacterized protein LOC123301247 [Chrysoperla carnea]